MKLSLMVLSEGKASGKAIPITLSQFVIGRDPQCQLRPASPIISKRHCAILVKGGKVFVRDFDSTNGTFVNEEQVKGERQVNHDDVLKIGPLSFKVNIQAGSTPVDKPTPPPAPKASATPAPPARADSSDDESVAAMLLSLKEGDGSDATEGPEEDDVPGGSTVMDLKALETAAGAAAQEGTDETPTIEPQARTEEARRPDPPAPPEKKEPNKKPASVGNTSTAAAAILAKYARRKRE